MEADETTNDDDSTTTNDDDDVNDANANNDLTIASAALAAIKINTDKTAKISNQLTFTTMTPTPTPIAHDCGLRFSDSFLHYNEAASKPPLPRGITISTTHRNRSRSIETATLHAHRGKQWKRKLSHNGDRLVIGAAEAR